MLVSLTTACSTSNIMRLPIGEPERSDQQVSVRVDTVIDAASGASVPPQHLPGRLVDSRLILVAEEHTSLEHHRVQLRVLEVLEEAGRALAIGLEMFPADDQAVLDDWIAGELPETEFVERSDWYARWGYHWGYYREIFLFAREHGLPMVALNAPRTVIADVGAHGIDAARERHPDVFPPRVDISSKDHRTLVGAFFAADAPVHGRISEDQFRSLFEAQCTWDAVMAYNAARFLDTHPAHSLVVLAGTGHVIYELGIARQAQAWHQSPATSIVPVVVNEADERVQSSAADFLWGVPDLHGPTFPELGVISMRDEDGLRLAHVEPESAAALGGMEQGDILTHLKGTAMTERADLNRTMATLQWGDSVASTVQRAGERVDLMLIFRREGP